MVISCTIQVGRVAIFMLLLIGSVYADAIMAAGMLVLAYGMNCVE